MTLSAKRAARERVIVAPHHVPRLRPYVRLQFSEQRGAWALLAPEHVYWPDEISLAILQKLDGTRRIETVISELAASYDAPEETVAGDVMEFLQGWADEHILMFEASDGD